MGSFNWKAASLGLFVAGSVGLSACGGGGSSDTSNSSSSAAADACAAVAGAGDPVQAALAQLRDQIAAVPTVGAASAPLVSALIGVIDAVDALGSVLQQAAMTQDPAQIAAAGNSVGAQMSCGLDSMSTSVQSLLNGVLAGTPAAAPAAALLAQIATLQSTLGSNPLSGGSSVTLATVSTQIITVSTQLAALLNQLPVDQVPQARLVAAALSASVFNFAILLNNVGAMNAPGTATALTNFYTVLSSYFVAAAVSNAGPVGPVIAQISGQINTAAAGVVPVLNGGLVSLLSTVFSALKTVLGGALIGPGQFQQILLGLIASTPVSGQFATLINSLAGGSLGVPQLSTLLGGVPVLADLVTQVLQSAQLVGSGADPTTVLNDVLNGTGGLPSLTSTLALLPNIGGGSVPGLAALQALVASLLALNGLGGVPEISAILAQVGGQFTQINLGSVTTLLNGLL